MPSSGGQKCALDRKSTRLNSSHGSISYAVFCLKKNRFVIEVAFVVLLTRVPADTRHRRSRHSAGRNSSSYEGQSRAAYSVVFYRFFFNDTATTEIYTLSLHDALPISESGRETASHDWCIFWRWKLPENTP